MLLRTEREGVVPQEIAEACFSQLLSSGTPWSDLEICGPSLGGCSGNIIALDCVSRRGTGMLGRRKWGGLTTVDYWVIFMLWPPDSCLVRFMYPRLTFPATFLAHHVW